MTIIFASTLFGTEQNRYGIGEHVPPDARPLVAASVLSVFRKVFHEFWGPRLEHVFRNCLMALLDVQGSTLLSVMRLLVDEPYRTRIVSQCHDPVVKFYWTHEWPMYPKNFLPEVISPVQNKLGAVLTNPFVRNVLGQPRSTIDVAAIMDGGPEDVGRRAQVISRHLHPFRSRPEPERHASRRGRVDRHGATVDPSHSSINRSSGSIYESLSSIDYNQLISLRYAP